MNYFAIKHLHTTAAALSILFFIVRAYWSVTSSPRLQSRVVRIAPHIIDTALLVFGVMLAAMIGPEQPWILAKIIHRDTSRPDRTLLACSILYTVGFASVFLIRSRCSSSGMEWQTNY